MERPSSCMEQHRGFSLIEALVVLVVTGAALMLVFSVGARSTEIAFRLGRRALDLADRQVSTDALRVMIRGLEAPPLGAETRQARSKSRDKDKGHPRRHKKKPGKRNGGGRASE